MSRGSTGRPLSVGWYLPLLNGNGYEGRPFAYTTTADSDWLGICADDGLTWDQARERSTYPSAELREVIDGFILSGHGFEPCSRFVRSYSGVVD
jgi:hypothetical protein